MLWQLVSIVFPIFAIVLAGFLYGRRHSPDMAAANKLNIEIFVPALIFDVLTGTSFNLADYQALALAGSRGVQRQLPHDARLHGRAGVAGP